MKSLEYILENYKSETLTGRDLNRLSQFVPHNLLSKIGFSLKEGVTEEQWNSGVKPFTKENILIQLESDVEFGFEKALNKRGLSAGEMYEVVKMWNWILEEGLEDWEDNYAMYGLPLLKATALKYGWDNPIGEDTGSEDKYNDNDYWE